MSSPRLALFHAAAFGMTFAILPMEVAHHEYGLVLLNVFALAFNAFVAAVHASLLDEK